MPKKKRKPSRSEQETIDLYQLKIRRQINEHFHKKYLTQSTAGVNSRRKIQKFDKRSRQLRDMLIDYSIESLAAVDGGEKVTDVLQELGFMDSEFASRKLQVLSVLFLRVRVFLALAEVSQLPASVCEKMLERYLAKLLPTHDNLPKNRPNDPQGGSNLMGQLAQLVDHGSQSKRT